MLWSCCMNESKHCPGCADSSMKNSTNKESDMLLARMTLKKNINRTRTRPIQPQHKQGTLPWNQKSQTKISDKKTSVDSNILNQSSISKVKNEWESVHLIDFGTEDKLKSEQDMSFQYLNTYGISSPSNKTHLSRTMSSPTGSNRLFNKVGFIRKDDSGINLHRAGGRPLTAPPRVSFNY